MIENCAGQRRTHELRVRLTPNEDIALEKMAQETNQDVSDLVRKALFKYNPLRIAKEEIQMAINSAKRTYRNTKNTLKSYIPNYEPAVQPSYANTVGYY